MARIAEPVWFRARATSAVSDFFDLCEQNLDAAEASARSLERMAGELPAGGVEQEVARTRDRLHQSRRGDWQPYEQFMRELGEQYARSGLAVAAWFAISNTFYETLVGRAVAAHADEPSRLTGVLLVLGEYMERSLALIATEYLATKDQLQRETEMRHTRVLDAALDAVIEIDERGAITELNLAAEQLFGHRKADALGRPFAALIIPERFRDPVIAPLFAAGDPRAARNRVELCALRADGSEIPVELAVVAIAGFDGRCRFTAFVRDLTEQRRAEESLAVQAHALEQAEFGVVISEPVSRVMVSVNPAYLRMTGYAADEMLGKTGDHLVAIASKPDVPGVHRELEAHGHATYALQLRRKDGAILSILASSSTVITRSGNPLRISTVIDISERDRLERARAAAAARLQVLASTAHEFASSSGEIAPLIDLIAQRMTEIVGEGCAVRLISDDGDWLEPSASVYHPDPDKRALARQSLGAARQRLGEGLGGRVAQTGVAILIAEANTAQILAGTPPAFRDLVVRMAATSVLTIPLRSRGRTIGAISLWQTQPGRPYTIDDQHLAQDLADRAALAIDNAALVATLEQRVADRTATLEAVNRELESFSYSVSHDLRAPLRAIDGFGKMLLTDYGANLDDRGRHYLSRIRVGTQRMAQLIDDLLDLARIARVSLTATRIDLSAVAGEVVAEIQKRDPGRSVPIHIAPGLAARADARLMAILLDNLLGNAWKFTAKQPGAEIWFGTEAGAFYVRDTGAGFDMAYADKLFLPFQRLHSDREYDGTGVGLATVHRIVTRHGGKIWADAAVGRGATFYFTLGEVP
jgi:PAS domain S-box-containing protein